MATFLHAGAGNCFGYAFGVRRIIELTKNTWPLVLACSSADEADTVGFFEGGALAHVAVVVTKAPDLSAWVVRSKTSTRTGVYGHTVQEIVDGFEVAQADPVRTNRRFSGQLPLIRYSEPVPMKRISTLRKVGF